MQGKKKGVIPHKPEPEIIKMLKGSAHGFVSGQALSSALGISRTAIWKHIKRLRDAGYGISAQPSKGYRLDETKKRPFNVWEVSLLLTTDFIGRSLHFYQSISSTNAIAFELGRNGCVEGAVVIADGQTKGKGRLGRVWASPRGVNLYTSIVLRPGIQPQNATQLTFLAAVAAAETVKVFTRKPPEVKWPNDILIDGRKAAGILLEMDTESDRVNFVVVGIGVNLNMRRDDLPELIKKTAVSLFDKTGVEVDRAEFGARLYSIFEKWYKIYCKDGFPPVLDEWKGYFGGAGKPVKISSVGASIEGVCMGVDADGALLVRVASGKVERVLSGDVVAGG
ncbi:MAG: biotin--[acetyl-CoA-carboxylase] ligase [Deltaproteobacteria bacterium]|nr:biotin--[acetyl-CoA-carboxylase] ligase [Deltaproteobacteria bacterium]